MTGEKKKAAILTWCDNNGPTNYGQILQCYAMQYVLSKNGYDPIVIPYRKREERDFDKLELSSQTWLGQRINAHYEEKYKIRILEAKNTIRVQKFRQFRKEYIPLAPPCYTKEEVEYMTKDCELLVCGSDQIWNPECFDEVWFLNFGRKNQRRVAYAPSGIFYENDENKELLMKMAKLIEQIDKVTVREKVSAQILGRYTEKKIQVAVDPVYLLTAEEWNQIATERLIEEDYIFCYVLGEVRPYGAMLRRIMQMYEVKHVVFIPTNVIETGCFSFMTPYEQAGPQEIVSLIKHATAVMTDSFHGTVFSMIYHKAFYNISRRQSFAQSFCGNERIDNLMEMLGLESRYISNRKELRELPEINWNDYIDKKEKCMRQQKEVWGRLRDEI